MLFPEGRQIVGATGRARCLHQEMGRLRAPSGMVIPDQVSRISSASSRTASSAASAYPPFSPSSWPRLLRRPIR